ncbi:MAG: transposase [Candidatus Binatia bacterium]
MIQEDAKRCLDLDEKIKRLEAKIAEVAKDSKIAKTLRSIPGFGAVCSSELAGEIGTIERFASPREAFLCISACPRWTTARESTRGAKLPSMLTRGRKQR